MCDTEKPTKEEPPQTEYDDGLNDIELSKMRDYGAASLLRLLRIETELLAEAKAKDQAMLHTYQSYMQGSQEERLTVDKEIATLSSYKEELQQQLCMQLLQRTQTTNETKTTDEMKTVLTQYYGTVHENYKNMLSEIQELQKKGENLLENHGLKKQSLREAIQNEDKNLSEIHGAFEKTCQEYKNEVNVKDKTLVELIEANAKCEEKIAQTRKKCEDENNEIDNNNKKLNELLSQNAELHNSKTKIDLECLQAQQLEKEQEHEEVLNSMRNNLNQAKDRLSETEQQKLTLQDDLTKECSLYQEREAVHSKLEEQLENLSSTNQSLKAAIEETETRLVKVGSELQFKLQETESTLTTLKEKSSAILSEKDGIINNLQHIEQLNNELEEKLGNMQNLKENLLKETETMVGEQSALQERKMTVEKNLQQLNTFLLDEREKYLENEASGKNQLEELVKKLTDVRIENNFAKYELGTKKEQLKTELSIYKSETEKALQENQQMNKHKLQQLEERLLTVKNKLAEAKERVNSNKALIDKKKALRDKLHNDWEMLMKSRVLQTPTKETKYIAEPLKPAGILKYVEKPSISPKKVCFREDPIVYPLSSDSSVDVYAASASQQSNSSAEEMFNKLLADAFQQKRSKCDY